MKIDRIIIDIEGNIDNFKTSLADDFTKYKGYKVKSTTENRTFLNDAGEKIQKPIHLLNIEDTSPIGKDKKALITLIPGDNNIISGDNTIKIVITGENKKPLEDKINQFIGKSSKFNKVGDKIKKSKLKEIIKGYVKEAIQRI
jgi:hypothetical protein